MVRLDRAAPAPKQWQQKMLAQRELSAPVVYAGRVVVADLEGYVHWFDPADRGVPGARAGRQGPRQRSRRWSPATCCWC